MEWREARTQQDLVALLEECYDFHDSCVVGVNYQTGSGVDDRLWMRMGVLQEHTLSLLLQKQSRPVTAELRFSGVRRFYFNGWRSNYFCDISSCHLAFYRGLLEGEDEPLIVWSDFQDFDPHLLRCQDLLDDSADSFILASGLKWRFVGE